MASLVFNAATVAPAQPIEPLPDGWFPVTITASEVKPTTNGSGIRFNFTCTVAADHPHYKNRKVFDGLNVQNANPVSQQIAQEQLSALCHAVGVIQLQDTNQLHNLPFLIKVKTVPKRTDPVTGKTYEPKNEITGYDKIGAQQVNLDPPANGGGAPTMAGAGGMPAWTRQAPPAAAVPAQQFAPAAAPGNVVPLTATPPPQQQPVPQPAAQQQAVNPWEGQPAPAMQQPAPIQQPAPAQVVHPTASPTWAQQPGAPQADVPVQQAQPEPASVATPPSNPQEVPAWARQG